MTHQTPTTTIPRCWERPGAPGAHAWGSICDHCQDWWVRRSQQDPRTVRRCSTPGSHPPHLWLRADLQPPLPYTMWRCGGRDEH